MCILYTTKFMVPDLQKACLFNLFGVETLAHENK